MKSAPRPRTRAATLTRTLSVSPPTRRRYDAHHKVTKESFLARVAESDFDAVRAPMNTLVALVASAEALAFVIESGGGLPEQIINADLHFDNVLCEGDNVTGVVDFEFAALDWRALRAQPRAPAAPASAPPNDPTTQP